jgi:hypothetical protein
MFSFEEWGIMGSGIGIVVTMQGAAVAGCAGTPMAG